MRSIRPFRYCRLWLFAVVVIVLAVATSAASQVTRDDPRVSLWMSEFSVVAKPLGNRPDTSSAHQGKSTE